MSEANCTFRVVFASHKPIRKFHDIDRLDGIHGKLPRLPRQTFCRTMGVYAKRLSLGGNRT